MIVRLGLWIAITGVLACSEFASHGPSLAALLLSGLCVGLVALTVFRLREAKDGRRSARASFIVPREKEAIEDSSRN